MNQLDQNLYDARIAFATSLDEGKLPDGTYAVDMFDLNISIADLRNDFLVKQLMDPRLTDHSRIVIDRVLRALDYMVEQTSSIGRAARAVNVVPPSPEPADGPPPDNVETKTLTDLEDQIRELIGATDPRDAGLNGTMDQLRAANKRLLPAKGKKVKAAGGTR